jgi:hypothetical protein
LVYYMFIVLNVFLPIYPVKRGFLEIHVTGFKNLSQVHGIIHASYLGAKRMFVSNL